MEFGNVTEYIDLTQILLYLFWIFFAALIFYLQRETRREGYPLEADTGGRIYELDFIYRPEPKTFKLHGGKTVQAPNDQRETRTLNLERTENMDGFPYEPTGNPMTDGIGPGSYAERADEPDRTAAGAVKIVPMSKLKDYSIAEGDPDPRGLDVVGIDDEVGGKIVDIWVDKSEHTIRYLEAEVPLDEGSKKILVPITFCVVQPNQNRVYLDSVRSDQLKECPTTKKADEVTFLEEDKICGFYGAGTLYAYAKRSEPLL